mgnify:CR=1 FL=1
MFQSLIGILQTFHTGAYCKELSMFQSLIGILQTLDDALYAIKKYLFQSLIGILQTKFKKKKGKGKKEVSIPHRYSTNNFQIREFFFNSQSFNPS